MNDVTIIDQFLNTFATTSTRVSGCCAAKWRSSRPR